MPRMVDADKLHYKNVWITSVDKNGDSNTSSDIVVFAREIDKKTTQVNWFEVIAERLRDYSEGDAWSDGECEILCKTESAASAIADILEQLYHSQNEDVLVNTGFYDPEEDKRNNEEDRYTGWWYVDIG